jgi:hypothetical protein
MNNRRDERNPYTYGRMVWGGSMLTKQSVSDLLDETAKPYNHRKRKRGRSKRKRTETKATGATKATTERDL